jgi:hypothetical protein
MSRKDKAAPTLVYLLADNLDAALAAGEDLLKSSVTWHGCDARSAEELCETRPKEREAFDAIRSLELILLARLLKSRESAAELARSESHIKQIAKLYSAGTALLADTVDELADTSSADFDTGDCVTTYLRSRGLIADDAPAPAEGQDIIITEDFVMCGVVPLGAVLDLVAHFLDTLETHYDLYDSAEPTAAEQRSGKRAASAEALY